ncbi:hypothetical protein GCM10007301_19280 [Azorhizobium oxalatiphilum]|uniref:Uncharacterized protein n=1 Tax=Azorhizobium oxalatiphilum TaxID=980631 RepID=A0A917F9H2_9HYPH|nr:hypothetical protein [Azorhizobium oxalatiphilum]GGF59687.1 hypothetical protein GCM10007301_19280 [Azorhizobium oxalatiphilum]
MMDARPAVSSAAITPPRTLVLVAAGVIATGLLLLPALANGFPFLFYDTGGYIEAGVDHVVKPGRSIIYGLLLQLGSKPAYWPVAAIQCALCVWVLGLLLRAHGLGGRPLLLIGLAALLSGATALPFVAGELMPDVFAGLVGLALYLLLWRRSDLRPLEAVGLALLIAIGCASHGSVLAIALLGIAAAVTAAAFAPALRSGLHMSLPVSAVALAILLPPVANLLTAGRFATTPGGTAFVFGRMLEDGLVARYLDDHCPAAALKLCALRSRLPDLADDFLWDDDEVFEAIGGFSGGAAEMRHVVLGGLAAYPLDNLVLAVRATLKQLVRMETGDMMDETLWHSTYQIRTTQPAARVALRTARQQQVPSIDFDRLSLVHVPVGLAASLGVLLLAGAAGLTGRREWLLLAGSVGFVLLANAAICGALSNPHDRYQSRIVWIAVVVVFIAGARLLDHYRAGALPARI